MTLFFTSVGFTVSMKTLKQGGISVIVFLGLASVLIAIQNIAGVSMASMFGLDPRFGLAVGSIPMVGGHATAASFGPVLDNIGVSSASAVSLAAATFGLVAGSLIGGPIGRKLIVKNNLKPNSDNLIKETIAESIHELNGKSMLNAVSIMFLAMGIGSYVNSFLNSLGITVPTYIGAMLVAAVIRNICEFKRKDLPHKEIDVVGSVGLALFLSMALMTLKLWELLDLAGPMVIMLLVQTIIMAIFAYFVAYNIMGRNYDAAVLSAAICGFGMGATPNAVANMDALTSKYGYSPKGYLVVPIVGGMFIDFVNIGIITTFLNFLG